MKQHTYNYEECSGHFYICFINANLRFCVSSKLIVVLSFCDPIYNCNLLWTVRVVDRYSCCCVDESVSFILLMTVKRPFKLWGKKSPFDDDTQCTFYSSDLTRLIPFPPFLSTLLSYWSLVYSICCLHTNLFIIPNLEEDNARQPKLSVITLLPEQHSWLVDDSKTGSHSLFILLFLCTSLTTWAWNRERHSHYLFPLYMNVSWLPRSPVSPVSAGERNQKTFMEMKHQRYVVVAVILVCVCSYSRRRLDTLPCDIMSQTHTVFDRRTLLVTESSVSSVTA